MGLKNFNTICILVEDIFTYDELSPDSVKAAEDVNFQPYGFGGSSFRSIAILFTQTRRLSHIGLYCAKCPDNRNVRLVAQ